jgi:hypothetical protein
MKKIVMEELSISFDEFLIMLIDNLGINLIDSVLIIMTGFECIS